MANANRGQVALDFEGGNFTLEYSINATCDLEDHYNLPIGKVAEKLQNPDGVRMSDLRVVGWAALREPHPDTDVIEAGRIANAAGAQLAMTIVAEAFRAAFPAPKGKPSVDPKKAARA